MRELELLGAASEQLVETARGLVAADLTAPSELPDWTRAHLLTHLARNADGLRNLLLAARSGEVVRMYASLAARAADIEAGAQRPADVIIDDVVESTRRFLIDARAMPGEAWTRQVLFTSGQPDPPSLEASQLVTMRLEEVAIHHVDLGCAFDFSDLDIDAVSLLMTRYAQRYEACGVDLTGIEGPAEAMLGWLARRRPGNGVVAESGSLPELPRLA